MVQEVPYIVLVKRDTSCNKKGRAFSMVGSRDNHTPHSHCTRASIRNAGVEQTASSFVYAYPIKVTPIYSIAKHCMHASRTMAASWFSQSQKLRKQVSLC